MIFPLVLNACYFKKTPHIVLVWEPGNENDQSDKPNIIDQATAW